MNSQESHDASSFVSLLRQRASQAGTMDRPCFSFSSDGAVTTAITFADLHRQACALATHLRQVAHSGDRVLLVYGPGLEFIAAFFGCLYAGVIAVPVPAPGTAAGAARLARVAGDADATVALTTAALWPRMRPFMQHDALALRRLTWLRTDELSEPTAPWSGAALAGSDTALLQYTSGSTGAPKGVIVSHHNLVANAFAIGRTLNLAPGDAVVSWLPLHHDMGLVGKVLYPLYAGAHCVHLSPESFLRRPHLWLKALSDHRARLTCAPNFAYELCARKVSPAQKALLDLGALDFALCGAEPVRAGTLRRFAESFADCGFRTSAFMPVYGLSESTLLVSANKTKGDDRLPATLRVSRAALAAGSFGLPEGDADALEVVSVGQSPDQRVCIADPADLTLRQDGAVGEICVSGASVAHGYWRRGDESSATFVTPLPGEHGHFLRTGDLGFMHGGALYVVGRSKDLMIFNGRNVYAQDVEAAVEACDPAFRSGGCAAFAVERDDQTRLTIVQEVESKATPARDWSARVRALLLEEHGLPELDAVLLVKAGALPRTTSGKVQRSRCREMFLSGQWQALHEWRPSLAWPAPDADNERHAPATPTEQVLARVWQALLHVDEIACSDNFMVLGGDSLAAAQLMHQVQQAFGVALPLSALLEAPTLAGMAALIDAAQASGRGAPARAAPLQCDAGHLHEPFPLTDIQQAYWLGRSPEMVLGNVAAHVYHELRVTDFDVARFERALHRLIERHHMLRAIVHDDGTQQILPAVPRYGVAVNDLRALPAPEAAAQIEAIRHRLSHAMRPTHRWPLFEFSATRLDERVTHLHLSVDLLIADATSAGILNRELARLYDDEQAVLPPLGLSFRDYVLARQAARDACGRDAAWRYWRARLPHLPPPPELPMAMAPEALGSPRFVRRSLGLPAAQWSKLRAHAASMGLTPSTAVLAVFAEVLARWSRHPRFTLNLTTSARDPLHPAVAGLVGEFTRLIPLEVNAAGHDSFAEQAQRLQAQLWRDIDHNAVCGVELQRELHRLHGQLGSAMGVVHTDLLALQADAQAGLDFFGRDLVHAVSQTPQVWLDHQVRELDGELVVAWDAVEALFPPGMLDQMAAAHRDLLSQLAEDPQAWTQPRTVPPLPLGPAVNNPELGLHELFELKAQGQPQARAVAWRGGSMSYAQLRARALAVSAALQAAQVPPGTLVPVVMHKGWEQLAATLGVMYAGAAYVPIDPSLPVPRLHHLLQQAQTKVVLTHTPLDTTLPWPSATHCIAVDRLDACGTDASCHITHAAPDDLAYVIYTSGSTGTPKGVTIEHGAAVNTLLDVNRRFALTSADRVLALSSLSFDLSVFDIFGLLAAGGTVVMPAPDALHDATTWLDLMVRHEVTVWNSVPALAGLLVEHAQTSGRALPASLRLVMLSGDWIPLDLVRRLQALLPQAQIVSLGGATEASIWSIHHTIDELLPHWTSVPYGKPLSNQSVHVLDHALRPRPDGVAGELYIGGLGLARGYWRDAAQTAAQFIVHPDGQRLYRTGDWGRRWPDGSIELLGREDAQVKVNGHRIELAEVEAALHAHPGVRAAVASVQGDRMGAKRLVAHVVAQDVSPAQLRDHLKSLLPHHMVPAGFMTLDTLPLTANGKVDRKALPQMPVVACADEPPCIETDAALADAQRAVQAVLGRTPGPDDNLYQLGADSLDLVRIANAVFSATGSRPDIGRFVAHPTVRTLVQARRSQTKAPATQIAPTTQGTTQEIEL